MTIIDSLCAWHHYNKWKLYANFSSDKTTQGNHFIITIIIHHYLNKYERSPFAGMETSAVRIV